MVQNNLAQNNLAKAGTLESDYVVIGGTTLDLDHILDETFFTSKNIQQLNKTFTEATPFPHIVFEDLFSPVLLDLIYAECDRVKWDDWRRFDNLHEMKRGTRPNTRFGNATQLYFNTIHNSAFVGFLERVTGIEGLIPDVTLDNGGIHEIPTGGKFRVHVDYNKHAVTKLDNRLVFITYLNKDWSPSYGGALELWSEEERKCEVKIDPIFGRSVMFYQSGKSLHGHPDAVNAPDGRPRRSVAAYFYSNGRLDGETASPHSTLYGIPITPTRREKIVDAIKYVIPPAAVDIARKLRKIVKP